ncbi:MAG: choice-of-anchor family protein [Rhodoglobus sp.]|nr:choice-of-anchor family protein [Rhodoglobus sp.]
MFTRHIPRDGSPVEASTHRFATRAAASASALALGLGLALVPVAANAETGAASYAEGQFLSGTLAGMDLANAVSLDPAVARNDGTQPKQTSDDPLNATVLQTVDVQQDGGIQTDLGDYVDAGTLNQYAEADKNGASLGASGAVGDDGAIGAGPTQSGAAGDVDVDLNSALDDSYDNVLNNLTLSLDGVAAQAQGNLDTAVGDYRLEGAVLTFTSPAIGDLTSKVNTALDSVDSELAALEAPGGALSTAVNDILNPILGIVGSSADVTVDITSDVHEAVQSLLTGVYSNGPVQFNLQTGSVSVDLEQLLGGDLNNLPVNTELLSDAVIGQVLTGITDTVSSLADQIVDRVKTSLHEANVDIHANLDLVSEQGSTEGQLCHDVQVPIIGDIVDGLGGLVGGLGGSDVTQGIIGYTTQTICETVQTVLPDLHSTANLDIEGTVDQLLDGGAAKAEASVSLLNGTIAPTVPIDQVIGGLGNALLDGLFGSDGAISSLIDSLNTGLVDPAVTGLLGAAGVDSALTDALSVRVNLQETSMASPQGMAVATGSLFTQTAVRVSALQGQLSTLNLAAATVGPNITQVIDPGCTVNCGPGGGGDPDPCTVNCGPGTPSTPSTPSATDRLAYTGVGIATLIAVILALLASGAYLAREGYRKNHPQALG